ncbi:MAG TPA: hypothetical protein VJT83_09945, partial [Chitinophagaceae bacterium]|nr:hypothetical protein [Chitinophagaceae bacterium]
YASSDTRQHVATSTIAKLLDYVMNSPEDGFTSAASVKALTDIIDQNKSSHPKQNEQGAYSYVSI